MTQQRGVKGVWVAYYPDGSELIIFNSEIEVLRTAVEGGMRAGFWPFGTPFTEVAARTYSIPERLEMPTEALDVVANDPVAKPNSDADRKPNRR